MECSFPLSEYPECGIVPADPSCYFYSVKKLILPGILFFSLRLSAQEALTYAQLLAAGNELPVSDSLLLTDFGDDLTPLDSNTVIRWYAPALATSQPVKMKNREFFLAGKITTNPQFDLHILIEDKKRTDSSGFRVVHLVSTHKDGAYISSLKASVTGTKKKSTYHISSWLCRGSLIVQDSRITTATASLTDVTQYRITPGGRFLMFPN